MKKVIFVIALALGGLTTYAQDNPEKAAVEAETSVEATAQEQDTYKEITVEELPEAVSSAVSKSYPTATINKAYMNDASQYKLEVSLQDGTAGTLYTDESGNWIE